MPHELIDAVRGGDVIAAMGALQAHPEQASARDEDGLSALMLALYRGLDDVAAAIAEALPELDVFEAASVGDSERVRSMVRRDQALANAWSPDGFTPLHYAAFFGHPDVARDLIQAGADVEAVSRNGRFARDARPLHSAAAARHVDVCAILLEAGADPNSRQHGGFTPLLEAAQHGDAELASLLLRHGADPGMRLANGKTAADLAQEAGATELGDRLRGGL